MKDVKHEQDPGEPEAGHRDKVEECAALEARILRDFNADEPDDIEYLNGGDGRHESTKHRVPRGKLLTTQTTFKIPGMVLKYDGS